MDADNPCSVMEPQYLRSHQRAASVAPPQAETGLRFSMDSSSTESRDSEDLEDVEEPSEQKKEERRSEDSDIQSGYVFPQEQYDRLHYETEHVKAMWTLEVSDE